MTFLKALEYLLIITGLVFLCGAGLLTLLYVMICTFSKETNNGRDWE